MRASSPLATLSLFLFIFFLFSSRIFYFFSEFCYLIICWAKVREEESCSRTFRSCWWNLNYNFRFASWVLCPALNYVGWRELRKWECYGILRCFDRAHSTKWILKQIPVAFIQISHYIIYVYMYFLSFLSLCCSLLLKRIMHYHRDALYFFNQAHMQRNPRHIADESWLFKYKMPLNCPMCVCVCVKTGGSRGYWEGLKGCGMT